MLDPAGYEGCGISSRLFFSMSESSVLGILVSSWCSGVGGDARGTIEQSVYFGGVDS